MNLISMLLAAPLCGALLAALCGKRGKYANYTLRRTACVRYGQCLPALRLL